MTLRGRPASLVGDFFIFSMIILSAIVVLSAGTWLQLYHTELQKRNESLSVDAGRISALFSDSLDHIAQYVGFIGERIARDDSPDLDHIAQLIGCRSQLEQDLNFMTTFDWVTPDKKLRVSSCVGALRQPFDMSDRDYLTPTAAEPWKLHLADPRYGGISKRWIIPAGMGITSSSGKFLGSITMGFSISELNRRIVQLLGEQESRFLIFTDSGVLLLDSKADNSVPHEGPPSDFTRQFLPMKENAYLDKPIEFDGYQFSYHSRVRHYPFHVLIGYDKSLPGYMFYRTFVPRIMGLTVLAAAALFLLYFMRRRLIRPVVVLADQAYRLSNGERITIEPSHVTELKPLEEQMQRISDYLETEQQVAEQLKRAKDEAVHSRDAAIRADQAKSEFLANMSHEIRTPLNAVIGLSDILLMQSHPPQRQAEFLRTIQTSANQLLQLINDLLDLAKLENAQVELEEIPFDLKEAIEEVFSVNLVAAQKKGIALRMGRTSWPPILVGDPLRLRQILINLVGNAVKFTENGTVTIDVDSRINSNGSMAHLRIGVMDTGVGIPSDQLANIFSKFSQADTSVSRKFGGTGLGLSISKTLVELMGGQIRVDSTLNEGSTFTLELALPLAEIATAKSEPQTAGSLISSAQELRSLRILVVEDNPANIVVISTLLESLSCNFEVASSGKEALRKLSSAEFDVVLMDVQMPEMDGFQVTRRLREMEKEGKRARITVIGLTAHALPGDREHCLSVGMDGYLPKPFNPHKLVELLRECRKATPSARPTAVDNT